MVLESWWKMTRNKFSDKAFKLGIWIFYGALFVKVVAYVLGVDPVSYTHLRIIKFDTNSNGFIKVFLDVYFSYEFHRTLTRPSASCNILLYATSVYCCVTIFLIIVYSNRFIDWICGNKMCIRDRNIHA